MPAAAGTIITQSDSSISTDEDSAVVVADGASDCDACCYVEVRPCRCNVDQTSLYALYSEADAEGLFIAKVRIEGECYIVQNTSIPLPEGGTVVSLEGVTAAEDCDVCCEECDCIWVYKVLYDCEAGTYGTPTLIQTLRVGDSPCPNNAGEVDINLALGSVPSASGDWWLYDCLGTGDVLDFRIVQAGPVGGVKVAPDEACPADPDGVPSAPLDTTVPSDTIGCLASTPPPCGTFGA